MAEAESDTSGREARGEIAAEAALPTVPEGATAVLRRDRLLHRLETLDPRIRLVLVAAPVGYGKTTLLGQWCEVTPRRPVWLTVRRADRDPHQLVRDLAAALLTLGSAPRTLGPLLGDREHVPIPVAADRLAAAVRSSGRPTAVVLDDLHEARTTGSLDLVERFAARLPADSLVVAAADRRPRLARLWSGGGPEYAEVTATDLEFTDDEIAGLLARAGVRLPPAAVVDLAARTERWPAAVQLAVTTLSSSPDPRRAMSEISGDHASFAEYVRSHVLAGLSVETARFLLRTSVLPRLSGPLCDAALDTVGSAAWLAELTTLGLPLVPLDDRGTWYRYRRPVREMLRAELRRREAGEDALVLRRAARWFEENALPEEAIDCAFAAGDDDLAAHLLVAHTQQLNSRGRIGQARCWLDRLGDAALSRHPPLAPMATWIWALTGDAPRALGALRIAELARFDRPLADGSASLESAVLRARAALAPHGIAAMLADARQAVELEPAGSHWHTMASLLLGVAQWLTGSPAEAARCFELAVRYGRRDEYPGASVALAERALLAADEEDWSTAEACALEAADLVDVAGLAGYGPSVASFLAAGRVAVHHGDVVAARHHLERAAALYADPSPLAFPWLAVQAAVELGRLHHALGEPDLAAASLGEARRHLAVLADTGLLTGWVESLAADLDHGIDAPTGALALTPAELRVLALLPTHLSLAQIGDELVVSRNTVKSQVAAIYRKLDAVTRADAVRRARTAGLLDVPAPRPPS